MATDLGYKRPNTKLMSAFGNIVARLRKDRSGSKSTKVLKIDLMSAYKSIAEPHT
jgi:hypothetical protein